MISMERSTLRKVQRHVRGLIAGGHTANVPKDLLPEIHAYLETELENSKSHFPKSSLRKTLRDVIIIEKRLGLIKNTSIQIPLPKQVNGITESDDIIAKVKQGITPSELNSEKLNVAINEVHNRITTLVSAGKLEDAQEYEDIIDSLLALEYGQVGLGVRQNKQLELNKQLQKLENERSRLKDQLNDALEKCDHETEMQLKLAEDEWISAIEDFDRETDKGAPSWERKFSGKVLELRHTERYLIKSRRFKEAKEVQAQADELSREEEQLLKEKYLDRRRRDRDRLKDVYDRKCSWIRDFGTRVRQRIESDGIKQVSSVEQTIENTTKRIGDLKCGIRNVQTMTSPRRARRQI